MVYDFREFVCFSSCRVIGVGFGVVLPIWFVDVTGCKNHSLGPVGAIIGIEPSFFYKQMNHAFQDIKTQLPTVLAQCNLDIVVPSDHAHRSLMRTPRTDIIPMLWESFKKYIFFFRFCLFVQKDVSVRLFLAAAVPFWLPFFVSHPILPPFHLPISLRYAVFLSSVFPAKKTLPFRHFELGYFPFISTPQPPELHVSRFVRVQVHVCVCLCASVRFQTD